jgi:hypothetical protein
MTAVALPSKASAAELNLTGMGLRDIVTINSTLPGFENGSFYAGQFLWDWSAPTPSGFDTSIVTYCVDILHEVQDPQQVVIDTTDNMPTLAQDGGGKAAWLLNTFSPVVTTGIQAAALQVAIWESIYDNDHDVTSGIFSIVTDNTALTGAVTAQLIANQAMTYLGQLFYGPNGEYHTATATWLNAITTAGAGQSQITTPEPASLLLVGFGAALAGLRRRRTQPARN